MSGTRAYDSTTVVNAGIFTLGTLVGTETLTLSGAGSVTSANAGTYSVALGTLSLTGLTLGNGTGLASNYTFTGGTQSVTIGSAALAVVTASDASKTYGTTYTLGTTAFTVTGLQGSDNISDVTLTSAGAVSTANAGTYAIVPSNAIFSVGSASNYTISYVNGTLTVNPAVLTATITGTPTKVYNGTTAATLAAGNYSISGFVTGEGATVTQTAGTYNSKDVLAATTVSATLAPADFTATGATLLSNYVLPTTATGAGTITPATLTATIAAPNKVYDGTTTATPTFTITGGLIGTETVTATGTATFNSKDVLTANLVTANSNVLANGLNGGLASNYSLATGQTVAASITPATLTATIAAPNKVYDGTTTATPTFTITGGLIGTETVTATGTATFNSKDVLSANLVTANSNVLADGTNGGLASNYSLATGQTVAASITPYAVSMSGTRAYDSTTVVNAGIFTLGTLVGTETLTLSGAGSVTSANAGTYSVALGTLSLTGLTLGNGTGLASNYTFTGGTQSVTIGSAALAVVTASDASKTYGTTYTLGTTAFTVTGLQGSDNISDVTLTSAGAVSTANAGTYAIVPSNAIFSVGSASNYTISYVNGTLTVNPAVLTATITGTPTKVYNGTTAATLAAANYSISGFVTGEGATVTQTAGTYNSKDVLAATTVSATLAPADFTATGATLLSNYVLPTTATGAGTITPATLTATIAAPNKVYDGTTTATPTFTITGGLIGTETVTATGTATFNSKDVLTANLVTANSNVLANGLNGGLASNYSLATGQTVAASITPATLTATIAAPNKAYDGTTTATPTFTITGGLIGTETVTATGTATFNSKDVLTANLVTANSNVLANGLNGGLASNYSLATGQTVAASITPYAVSMSGTRAYDSTTVVNAGIFTLGTLVGTETLTLSGAGSVTSANAGTYSVALGTLSLTGLTLGNGTGLASNYTFTGGIQTATISAATLAVVTASDASKTYGTTYTLGTTAFTVTGLQGSDNISDVTLTSAGAVSTANAGTYAIVPSNAIFSVGSASNYTISYVNGTLTVNPAVLTATITGTPTKVYNGTTAATLAAANYSISGFVTGEGATVTQTAGTYNSKDVLAATTVSATLAPADFTATGATLLSNYVLPTTATGAGTITPATLTATIAAPNKVYDGTTTATPTFTITGGLIGTETVTATGTATFNSKDVLTANLVTANSNVLANGLNGGLASNYSLATGQTVAASITPATLTATIAAPNKAYDGTTTATPTFTITGGLIGTETVTATGTATFNSKDVLTANLVTANSNVLADGLNGGLASNYSLATGQTVAASITPATLTATIAAPNKVYDGTTTATPTFTITGGLIGTETVTATGTATFNSKDVLTANLVTANSNVLANGLNGGLASNYSLATGQTVAASITPATLTATIAAPNKVYDGTTTATPTFTITGGLIGTETVTATGTATFNSKDVLTANLVTANSNVLANGLNGGLASNYSLATGQTVAASITPATLTATIAAPNKVYDGTTTATPTFTITGGLVGTETVTATGTATFNSKDVLTANLVTANSNVLADGTNGGLASNYSLATGQTVAANITPATLTATIAAPNKVYDGTTTATPTFTITGGLVGTETVTATGTATFNSKDVLTANLVTANSNVLADGTNGGLASNYSLATGQTVAANITPATLTATIIGTPTKVYDGTTAATLAAGNYSISGFVTGEGATVTQTAGTYNSKDVLAATTVSATLAPADFTATGATLLSNYVLPTTATGAGTINPFAVSMTGTRVYDGTVNADAGIFTLGPLVGTETLTLSGSGTVPSKDVGTYPATLGTLALGDGTNGGVASNYTFAGGTQTVTIDPAPLYVAIVGNPTKVYDGTTGATLSSANYALTGFVSGEGGTVNTGTVGSYYTDATLTTPSKDVLTATTVGATLAPTDFTANAGTLLSNYILPTSAVGPGQITPYVVSMTGSRQYNGTANVAASMFTTPPGTMGTLVGTETLTLSGSGTVASKNVGTYTTTLGTLSLGTLALGDGTNGGLASNYTLIGGTQTATITPYVVKLYGSRSYDTTATVNASAFGTVYGVNVGGITETLTLTGSGSMADKNAGLSKPVALGTLALSDGANLGSTYSWLAPGSASNYTLVGSTPKISILGVPISVTGLTAQNKVYDGNTTATLTGTAAIGSPLSGDIVYLTPGPITGVFANKNVGNKIQVILSASTLSGADAGNYILQQPVMNANITARALTYTGTPSASNKVYDGTTIATLSGITVNGLVSGDAATLVGIFSTPNVGTGLNVSIALTGKDAANYSYNLPGLTANITPRALTYTGTPTALSRVYNGTRIATVTGITIDSTGLVAGDVNDITVSGLFADKNVGTGKSVTLALSGLKASNYTLPVSGLTADITKATIANVTGIAASNKTYDTTAAATLITGGAVFAGMVAGDVLTVNSATGAFSNKNAGTGKTVNISGITLGGADAGNYTLTSSTASTTANITPATITVTGVTAANKVYDATTAATLGGTAKITPLGSDVVNLGGSGIGVFANKNAGNGKVVNVSGYTISGADAGNYTLVQPAGVTANITKRALAYSGTPVVAPSRVYDGTTLISVSGATLNGVLGGDTANLAGLFADPNVGMAKPVTLTLIGTDGGNYSVTQPGGLTANITPRLLTVTADDKTMMFGGTIPELTYTVGGQGLVGADTKNTVFSGLLAVNTAGVNPGFSTPITQGTLALTVGPGGNYSISLFVNGVMTVQ